MMAQLIVDSRRRKSVKGEGWVSEIMPVAGDNQGEWRGGKMLRMKLLENELRSMRRSGTNNDDMAEG